MLIEIFYTQDEQDVLRMEVELIRRMVEKGEFKGELAEAGVYQGGTAEIINKTMPGVPLHLFDTFTGLPNTIKKGLDSDRYYEGHMQVDFEKVKYYFEKHKEVKLYPGFFPDTAGPIKNKKFVFVHIDLDIYQSTRDALLFFYPRLVIGGSIIMHDYPAHAGVKLAVDQLMDGVGTMSMGKWKTQQKNPMIQSGFRQLIIRKRIPDLKLNKKLPPLPRHPQVYEDLPEDLIK